FSLQEVPRVLVGAAGRLTVGTLRDHALVGGDVRALRAFQLRFGEAEPNNALEFGDKSVEPARHAVVGHYSLQERLISRLWCGKQSPSGARAQKRRVVALLELCEPLAQHPRKELIEQD